MEFGIKMTIADLVSEMMDAGKASTVLRMGTAMTSDAEPEGEATPYILEVSVRLVALDEAIAESNSWINAAADAREHQSE